MRFVAEPPAGWVPVEGDLASLRPSLASLGVPLVCAVKSGSWASTAEQAVVYAPGWAEELVRGWPRSTWSLGWVSLLERVVAHVARLPDGDHRPWVRGVLTLLSLGGGDAVASMLEEGA